MQNVKQNIVWIWQNAEKLLIVLFFLTFSLNIRKVFLTPYSFLNGTFNEYMTPSLSWTNILIIAIILIYTIKFLYSQSIKQISKKPPLYNVIRNSSSVIRNYYAINVSRETFLLEILLVWTGISIFWSQFSTIAFFRYFSIIGLVSFVYISTRQLQRANWLNLAIYALLINGLFQSILGIAQFIHNGSLGLRFIGESIVGPEIDGVAKILINGERHIRAYGTLPHPNILAGFLLVPLFLILAELAFRKIWGTHQYSYSQATLSNQTTDTPDDATLIKVSHETLFGKYSDRSLCIFGTIVACAFLLTFSRSALLAAFIGFLAFLIWVSRRTNLNYSTILSKKSFKSKLLVSTMLLVSIFIVEKQTSLISTQSLKERNLYNIVSYETILQHPIRGIGVGQFIMNEYAQHPDLEGWQYQPVHNVYLLILSELGIVGAILAAIATLSLVFKIYGSLPSPRAPLTYILFCCILLSFTIIGLFDHYLYDIGPGMNLLAVVFSLLLSQTGALKTNKLPTNSMR